VVGEEWNPQILVNLPVPNIPSCVSRNAKTLGLQHLKLPDVAASSGTPDRKYVIHHRTDEPFAEQNIVSDGHTALLLLRRRTSTPRSLSCLLSHLVDVCRPGKLSRVSTRYRAVSTHCIGSTRNCTALGFGCVLWP
jgi:hypothetical protein